MLGLLIVHFTLCHRGKIGKAKMPFGIITCHFFPYLFSAFIVKKKINNQLFLDGKTRSRFKELGSLSILRPVGRSYTSRYVYTKSSGSSGSNRSAEPRKKKSANMPATNSCGYPTRMRGLECHGRFFMGQCVCGLSDVVGLIFRSI